MISKAKIRKNRKAWVEALRSGQFRQGREKLKTPQGSYCCLGVAACVLGVPFEGSRRSGYYIRGASRLAPELLPRDIAQELGLSDVEQSTLAGMNDGDYVYDPDKGTVKRKNLKSFAQIAEYIETTLPIVQ